MTSDRVVVVDHPMVQHKLSKLRNKNTSSKDFRELVKELAMFEGYEATRNLALEDVQVETPICETTCKQVAGKKMVIVPILRAGLGMVEGIQELMPSTFVGHLGMYRDPVTHEPHEYYAKLPDSIDQREVMVVDPMLATGGSAVAAIQYLRKQGVKTIKLVVLVAAPEGIEAVLKADPEVEIYTCAIDEGLNDHAYIIPGLGDAGDRIFGTK
ncbi:uracil phosphoribosyltransferase [Adlercreutzia agrestimuris]|uniref:uracil phosphoribosyltransferase n=1 Tax=Adlercreutzia agrestimuris TaxID=2941324 RepID=UPI00203A5052|nr:uracil phosphoribosyltransferase [Adlercreutzia agrestimuris]